MGIAHVHSNLSGEIVPLRDMGLAYHCLGAWYVTFVFLFFCHATCEGLVVHTTRCIAD